MEETKKDMMDHEESIQRLQAIAELIDGALNSQVPMLVSTERLLERIQSIALGTDDDVAPRRRTMPVADHVIMSCDASITKNPGGKVAVGVVVESPGEEVIEMADFMRKSSTNNQGEYDAIYVGLTTLMSLRNNPGCEIEIRSDSKLVVDQLNGKIKCNDPELQKRRDLILELIAALPVPVSVQWYPRNSTPALLRANHLAQDALSIRHH